MKVLIVYAHQEPKSFNGAMLERAQSALTRQGHEVRVSDLYAMGFKAVADAADFEGRANPDFFKYQAEQTAAVKAGTLAADIRAEQEKVFWCDLLVLQFPLWWFGLPAIMKGWVDRVFTMGNVYGSGLLYDTAGFRGRRAMLALTTGGPPTMYAPNGRNGDIEKILFPINHGMLAFTGFTVLQPFVAWSVARAGDDARRAYLDEYEARLLAAPSATPIAYPTMAEFDEKMQLREPGRILI